MTTSADVTVSTNLGAWVNQRGVFARRERPSVPTDLEFPSPQKWTASTAGQHIELGIAENTLFILLGAFGLAGPLFGRRLLPIGTVYDPFVIRGLDALNYACYQNARFILVGTPSSVTLAPEGGAHQSIYTSLIGISQAGLTAFEPAFADELAEMIRWSFDHLQADDGGAVYLRLSTRQVEQPPRELTPELRRQIVGGAYWLIQPDVNASIAVVAAGAVVPEALEAHARISQDIPGIGLLLVTSVDRLYREWLHVQQNVSGAGDERSHIASLLESISRDAVLVTVCDAHPATLSWLGAVHGQRAVPLGVDRFGQSGDIPDLYREYGLDADAIVTAAMGLRRVAPRRAVRATSVLETTCHIGKLLDGAASIPAGFGLKEFSILAFAMKAAARALAYLRPQMDAVDIAIPVDATHGTKMRVIRSADKKSILAICAELRSLGDMVDVEQLAANTSGAHLVIPGNERIMTADADLGDRHVGTLSLDIANLWGHLEGPRDVYCRLTVNNRVLDGSPGNLLLREFQRRMEEPFLCVLT